MTTIAVAKKNGRTAIAADTLSTIGSTKCDSKYLANGEKILQFSDNHIGLVGEAAHAHVFASIIKKYPKHLSFNSATDIFESYLKLHPILKDEFYLRPDEEKDDSYESSRIDALIANPYGIFGISSWREVDEYNRFWAIGSGELYALGAMHAVYEQMDDAEEIARIGVAAGCEFDDGSGLPCISYTVKLRPQKRSGKKTK